MLIFKKLSLTNRPAIPFMKWRQACAVLTAALLVSSVLAYTQLGLNLGIDFTGGTLLEVENVQEDANLAEIRAILADTVAGDVTVQEFGAPNVVMIRIGETEDDAGAEDISQDILTALGESYELRRVERVGPRVSSELFTSAMIALGVAAFGTLVYLWFRFEWQFAVGAVVTTVNDVIITLGFYALVGLDFNLSSIAALLTIVGYSLNDTVIIYDRIRETLRRFKKRPMPDIINTAVTETLSRTFNTTFTTLLALFALAFFGGEVLASFTWAMIFGIFIGTFSSVFVASPLLILLGLRAEKVAPPEKSDV